MRIWLLNHYALPPRSSGSTRHYDLAKYLVRLGHDVTIVACSTHHYSSIQAGGMLNANETFRHEVIGGVRFVWLRAPQYSGNSFNRIINMLVYAFRAWRRIGLNTLPPPDIVWGSSAHLFTPLAGQQLAKHYGVPFVFEIRDLWPQSLIDLDILSRYHPLVILFALIEKHLYRTSDYLITLLPHSVDYIAAKGADPKRVLKIPNGVDFERLPKARKLSQNDMYTLMYAGSLGLPNAIEPIVEAAEILQYDGTAQHIRVRIIGDGVLKSDIQRVIETKGLQNITLELPKSKAQIYSVLQEADAFIITTKKTPLYRWGISMNKLFDYMATGRPVILSLDAPYSPLDEAQAGITVPAGDVFALVDAIKRLASMSIEERQAMGQRGYEYIEEHHNIQKLAGRIEELFISLIEEKQLVVDHIRS